MINVHPESACEGRPCCIHHPSDHHMVTWPQQWRSDRYLMERICPHGIGHPDPDHMAYVLQFPGPVGEYESGVHGCDGCCYTEPMTLAEVWYWCATCGCRFPASEVSSHKGHRYWAIDVQS